MAKITFNGKDRTTPFTWKGKQVVKLTLNGKVCTLTAGTPPVTPTGGFCGVMDHTYPNGFAYAGTWPAAQQTLLDDWSTRPVGDSVYVSIPDIPGVTAMIIPTSGNVTIDNNHLVCISAPNAANAFNCRSSTLESLSIPLAGHASFGFLMESPIKTLYAPKLHGAGGISFTNAQLTDIDLPELTIWGVSSSVLSVPITNINLPKITYKSTDSWKDKNGQPIFHNIVNAASTTVTLPSAFNYPSEKDKLFGPGNWDQITFTWV